MAIDQDLPDYGFIENKGQVLDQDRKQNHDVRYLHPGTQFNVALKYNGYSYDLFSDEKASGTDANGPGLEPPLVDPPPARTLHVQRVDFVFEGTSGAEAWTTGPAADDHMNVINEHGSFELLHHFGQVTQHGLYPGVDIRYAAGTGRFKQDIIAASPEALAQVRFRLAGALAKAEGNALHISTSRHSFTEEIPLSYIARADGSTEPLAVTYVENADGTFGFRSTTVITKWNDGDRLVVDPTPNRIRGSYFSGTDGFTTFYAVLAGSYMAGTSTSTLGLATGGTYDNVYAANSDAILVKMTNCARSWATYYGGNGVDQAKSLAWPTGDSQNILIGGHTQSTGSVFGSAPPIAQQTYGGGAWDGFAAKFTTNGGLRTWGTYCGGTGTDLVQEVASDQNGNVFVVGTTSSGGMATVGAYDVSLNGTEDAFYRSYPPTGASLLYGTYYGGDGADGGYGIKVAGKAVYICGQTNSANAIGTAGTHQQFHQGGLEAFMAKFTGATRNWGTYYGGDQDEVAYSLALIGCGKPTMVGFTTSDDLIAFGSTPHQAVYGGGQDGFIAEFNPANGAILFGTYYGGEDADNCHAIIASGTDLVYVTGQTYSTTPVNAIASPGSWQTLNGGLADGWFARFNTVGGRVWGSYYGGTGHDWSYALSTGPATGNVTIAGGTFSPNAIASAGCYDLILGAQTEGFYATFDGPAPTPCPSGMMLEPSARTTEGGLETMIFPVPFTDAFTIHTTLNAEADAFLRLVDLTGRTVLEQRLGRLMPGGNLTQVQCPALADGMYTWVLRVGDAISTGTVIRSGK